MPTPTDAAELIERLAQVDTTVYQVKYQGDRAAILRDIAGLAVSALAVSEVALAAARAEVERLTAERDALLKRREPTQMERLVGYAAANPDGLLLTVEAKRLLMAGGHYQGNPKNALSHIYRLLSESNDFEWVRPGQFRLVTTPPTAADADGTPPQRDPAGEGVS